MKRTPIDHLTASAVFSLGAIATAILVIVLIIAVITFIVWDFSIFIEMYKGLLEEWGLFIRIFLLLWVIFSFVFYRIIRKTK